MKNRAKLTPKKKASAGEWKTVLLRVLAKTANVRASCQAANVSRQVAYQHRTEDAVFREQWEMALEEALELLEEAARKRAMKSSDVLLIFLLKAHRPEKYREQRSVRPETVSKDSASIHEVTFDYRKLSDEELTEFERLCRKCAGDLPAFPRLDPTRIG